MLHIALYQPKMPANTGNVIRFCANTGLQLHVIHPLGFFWDNKQLRRAGLDYAEFIDVVQHEDWQAFLTATANQRRFIITTKGEQSAFSATFQPNDMLIFGSEDAGIASEHMNDITQAHWLRLPMKANSRSMNLANTVAIMGYEGLRQLGFEGLA